MTKTDFWKTRSLADMSANEWESLCDGCGRCCMLKLEDEATGEVSYTAMVCDLLDLEEVRCTRYPERHRLVPDCVVLDAQTSHEFKWLPASCAYRTLAEGRDLEWWHPLVSGNSESVREAGISVHGRVVPESQVHPQAHEDMIVRWVEHA